MMPRTIALLLLTAVLTAACGDDPAGTDDGRLSLAVISGDSQVVQAGSGQLPEPVVGRLVRLPSGEVAWSPLDLLVRPAYAQTVVQGAPVPGAVVCAVPLTDGGPKPFVPCTNTDQNGQATFFFEAGTRAGDHVTEIRGTVDQQPAVFDSVYAVIEPGRPTSGNLLTDCQSYPGETGAVDLTSPRWASVVEDAYGNRVLDWHFEAFPTSSLYTIGENGKTIIALPNVSGMDSVRVVSDGQDIDIVHVAVRLFNHLDVPLWLINLPDDDRQCP